MGHASVPELTKGPHMTLPSSKVRLYLYGVVSVALTVLVAYKLVDADAVPMWLNVAGTVLAVGTTSTAGLALSQQRKTGEVEPGGKHSLPE